MTRLATAPAISRAARPAPRPAAEAEPHAADVGLVHEPGRDRLERHVAAELGGAARRRAGVAATVAATCGTP